MTYSCGHKPWMGVACSECRPDWFMPQGPRSALSSPGAVEGQGAVMTTLMDMRDAAIGRAEKAETALAESNAEVVRLRASCEDARGERDAYMKSYKEACGDRDQLQSQLATLRARVPECVHGWRGAAISEQIQTPCPACGLRSVFIGNGGYLTCTNLSCPDPSAPHDRLTKRDAALSAEAGKDIKSHHRGDANEMTAPTCARCGGKGRIHPNDDPDYTAPCPSCAPPSAPGEQGSHRTIERALLRRRLHSAARLSNDDFGSYTKALDAYIDHVRTPPRPTHAELVEIIGNVAGTQEAVKYVLGSGTIERIATAIEEWRPK